MDSKINKAIQQELEIPTNLSARLENLIDSLPQSATQDATKGTTQGAISSRGRANRPIRKMVLWLSSTAAVVALLCALAINSANNNRIEPHEDTYANVKEAEMVAIETFKLVAQNYKKGTQTVHTLSDEIKKVNQTINKTITTKQQ